MRTSVGFNATIVASPETTAAAVARGGGGIANSAWHSPVPYLFGGLAAMLGLISFALLILACSYWKLSGLLDSDSPAEAPKPEEPEEMPAVREYEERVVVIMAGEEMPRYLATPSGSRASSFGDKGSSFSSSSASSSSGDDGEVDGKRKDDVVIEAESWRSNMEESKRQNNVQLNQINHQQ